MDDILEGREEFYPIFRVERIRRSKFQTRLLGRFTLPEHVYPRIAYLIIPPDGVVEGKVENLNSRWRRTRFITPNTAAPFEEGQRYLYLDGYWSERAEFTLSPYTWERRKFQPRDMIVRNYPDEGVNVARPVDESDNSAPEEWVVRGGWDHEHCFICNEAISLTDQPYGYVCVERPNFWYCEQCYSAYVRPKNLDFLPRIPYPVEPEPK